MRHTDANTLVSGVVEGEVWLASPPRRMPAPSGATTPHARVARMTQPTEAPVAATASGPGPRGVVLATLGFLVVATGCLMLLVGSLLWGLDGAFFALPTVLALLGACLIRRARTALRIGGLVLSVLAGG